MQMHTSLIPMAVAIILIGITQARSVAETTPVPSTSQHVPLPEESELQSISVGRDRTKRQYGTQNFDYYNQYYNNYYSNYYANQYNPNRKNEYNQLYNGNSIDTSYNSYNNYNPQPFVLAPSPPPILLPGSADRFDANTGNVHYIYKPLFQYKETHGKHEKLFVPNIFGWGPQPL